MKVFLTGATGFIGQALVGTMRRRGWAVDALVRDPAGAPARWVAAQGCTLLQGDVTRSDGLAQAMAGADVVLHNAGVYEFGASTTAAARMRQANVVGTDTVLGAAFAAGVPRTVYVSTVWALGGSDPAGEPARVRDETTVHAGRYLTPYEASKAEAHQIALGWRVKGLPLVIGMPNGVMGANDHSSIGYFLRLFLLHCMPPMGFGANTTYSLVEVNALAEGLCLAGEKAPIGEDYLFCGEPAKLGDIFRIWHRQGGGFVPLLDVPQWLMGPMLAPLEPLQRAVGLPAFLGRDTVDATRAHLNYSAAKARRDLGWRHPPLDDMWRTIVSEERALMRRRSGWLNKLRHQAVVDDEPAARAASAS